MIIIKINYASTLPNVNITYDQSNIYAKVVYGDGGGGTATWGLINGTLSDQTDLQNALNAKQDDITLTTIGNSGASTFVGNVLNIPQYTDQYVGTVTSVNMSVPTGLTISGNPITTSGTLAVGLQSGYSIPTTANQANWTTAYNDSIISAGVTGTTTKTLTLNQQDGGSVTASWTDDNTDAVTSVFGRIGAVIAQSGDYTTTQVTEGTNLYYTDLRARAALSSSATGLTYNNTTGVFTLTSNYIIPTTTEQSNWTTAYNDSIISAAVTGTTTKTLTLNQQDGGTVTASWTDINTDAVTSVFGRTGAVIAAEGDYTLTQLGDVTITTPTNGQVLKYNGSTWVNNSDSGLTSVGLSMPVAFSVANTPLTANGTLAVSAIGTASQYIRGDGQLATFPSGASGGSSVNYYLNGSVNQGTIGGSVYYEMNRNAVIGAGTDFIRTNLQGDGLIAQFITDANDPNRLEIPSGAWNFEMYFSSSSAGGTPGFYVELLKYDGSTFTSIANGSTNPEGITGGTSTDLYLTSLAVPQTILLTTDRLAIRVYVITSGKDITLHTEDNNLCEIITTFAGGIAALNGLTANTQYLAVGTSGTDFAISSVSDTHTFNLPTASATNRGALSSTDWTTFNNKQNALTNPVTGTGTTNYLPKWTSGSALGDSAITDDGTNVTINGSAATYKLKIVNPLSGSLFQSGIEFIRTTVSGGSKIEAFRDAAIGGVGLSFQVTANNAAEISATYTQAMTLDASGNLGLGTTSSTPYTFGARVLNILSSGVNSEIKLTNSTTGNAGGAGLLLAQYGVNSLIINANTGYLLFATSDAERMRLTSGGNLLVGTAVDGGYKLDVNGTARVQGDALYVYDTGSIQLGRDTTYSTPYMTLGFGGRSNGFNRIYGARDTTDGIIISSATGRGINLLTNGDSVTALTLASSGAATFSSSVTTGSTLNISAIAWLQFNGANTLLGEGTNTYLQANGSGSIIFRNNTPSELMRITSGGNLLVGTTTDSGEKLQVTGTAKVSGNLTVDTNTLFVDATNNRVGIGTSSPNTLLDVYTSQGGSTIAATHGSAGSYPKASGISFGATSTSLIVNNNGSTTTFTGGAGIYANNSAASDNPTDLILWTTAGGSPSERMRLTSGGNVGIGTTSPNSNGGSNAKVVHINSSGIGDWSVTHYTNGSTGSGQADGLIVGSIGADAYIFNYEASPLLFGTNSSERLRITSGGNLLIGTTTDSGYKFDVNGTGRIQDKVNFKPIATPSTANAGDVYYDSTTNKLRCYNGTTWNDLF